MCNGRAGGTGDAGFVIKLGNEGCKSHVYRYNISQRILIKCWKIGVLDRPENVHRKQGFFSGKQV